MPHYIALLRGINVGGHNKVAMQALREMCESLGLSNVQTVVQSGNLVFQCKQAKSGALERQLEQETAKRLGVSPDYFVRTAEEWEQIVRGNPFPKAAKEDPGHLLVMCLKTDPSAEDVESLRAAIKGPETIASDGRQLYLVYPGGVGRSKLTGTLIERKLGTKGTARNWNTVLKLLELCR